MIKEREAAPSQPLKDLLSEGIRGWPSVEPCQDIVTQDMDGVLDAASRGIRILAF